MHRLEEARVFVSVSDDGSMRIIVVEETPDGREALFSPRDMYQYIQLEPHEQRMLYEFKKRFGGRTTWKPGKGNQ
jgi:hypothetical protein